MARRLSPYILAIAFALAAQSASAQEFAKHFTKSRSYDLPVRIDKDARDSLKEIRLYVKKLGGEWALQESASTDVERFRCKVDADGEYWYMLATVDKNGKQTPADISTEPPSQRVVVGTTPQPAEKPAPSSPEPAKKDVDALVKKTFGDDSAELKRAIRIWLPSVGMIVAADKTEILPDGSMRFTPASLAFPAEPQVILRGDRIVLFPEQVITQVGELGNRRIVKIEIHRKDVVITLTNSQMNGFGDGRGFPGTKPFAGSGAPFGGAIEEKKPEPPPPPPLPSVPPTGLPNAGPVPVPVKGSDLVFPPANVPGMDIRFKFNIDPKTPIANLLPTPLKTSAKLPHWSNEDLRKVPELAFGASIARDVPKHKAMELTAHGMAKINHLNAKKTDGFLLAMLDQRTDLRGLPFLMGDECRTREEQARIFAELADAFNQAVSKMKAKDLSPGIGESLDSMWGEMIAEIHAINTLGGKESKLRIARATRDHVNRAAVAAMTQILMPESEHHRVGLAKCLASIPHVDATRALARLAIFSPEDEVRAAAIEGLKLRREKDYTDILLEGFRYPLPAVSKRAAEALVKLERKDLLENLVQVLESPDPRLPVTRTKDGKEETVVRELVKVNHHRNCLLCHAPGNTDNTPEGVLKVAVPLPGEPLPKPSEGGGYNSTPPPTPDIVVRIDMTYLRQDFSVMMPVSDAHPWPEMQRFDFLVRTRSLSASEAKAYEPAKSEDGQLSPHHRSALYALRELTGRDTAPDSASWRKLLKLAKNG